MDRGEKNLLVGKLVLEEDNICLSVNLDLQMVALGWSGVQGATRDV